MSFRTCSSLSLVVVAASIGSLQAQDWPQFRGPQGLGEAVAKNLPATWGPEENVVWKKELPGPGTSTPVLIGSRIYLTCWTGYNVSGGDRGSQDQLRRHLICLNRADGATLWSREVPARLPEQERIRDDHGYASSSAVADDKNVFVFFGKTGVLAFDHDGKQLWQADVGDGLNGWGSAASPILHGNLVIVNASVESSSLIALDRATGKEVWRAGGIRESWNTPILVDAPGGRKELVLAIFGKILAFDPADGKQLWSCATDIGWYMVPCLTAHDGIVYCIGGRSGGALAVKAGGAGDVTATHRLWTGRKGSNVSSLIHHEGHLYWAHDNIGVVYCAEAKSGKIVYEERLPRAGQFYPSPILADGKLFYLDRQGRCFVVAAQPEFRLLETNELEQRGTFNASPAAAGDRLYLRSNRYLYCLGKK